MSLPPQNKVGDYSNFYKQYMADLNYQIKNNALVYNAVMGNISGQVELITQPQDTRSTEQKLADNDMNKAELFKKLLTLMDSDNATQVINNPILTATDFINILQSFPTLYNILKPLYSKGVSYPIFLEAYNRLETKKQSTAGVDLSGIPTPITMKNLASKISNANIPEQLKTDLINSIQSSIFTSADVPTVIMRAEEEESKTGENIINPDLIPNLVTDEILNNLVDEMISDVANNSYDVLSQKVDNFNMAINDPNISPEINFLEEQISTPSTPVLPYMQPPQPQSSRKVTYLESPGSSQETTSSMTTQLPKEQRQQEESSIVQMKAQNDFKKNKNNKILYPIKTDYTKAKVQAGRDAVALYYMEQAQQEQQQGAGIMKKYHMIGKGVNINSIQKPKKSRAIKLRIDDIIEKPIVYKSFGKYVINQHKLSNNILMIRSISGAVVPKIPTQSITSELCKILISITHNSTPNFEDINKLSDDDKNLLHKILQEAHITSISIPSPDKTKYEQDYHKFLILKGEILAGNNSKIVIGDLKRLIIKLLKNDMLPRKEANESLYELAILEV